jgi:hypothetical protein
MLVNIGSFNGVPMYRRKKGGRRWLKYVHIALATYGSGAYHVTCRTLLQQPPSSLPYTLVSFSKSRPQSVTDISKHVSMLRARVKS